MKVQTQNERNANVISVEGEVDLQTSPELRKVLLARLSEKRRVVVDLSDVPYMDSSGIACLVEAYQKARAQGSEFVLTRVGKTVLNTLALAKLNRVFTITADLDEALGEG